MINCGPHSISDEQRGIHARIMAELTAAGVMPLDDVHKVSDEDELYRYLFGRVWNEAEAVKGLEEYAAWRKEVDANNAIFAEFPDSVKEVVCGYCGVDREGRPIYYDQPDPKLLSKLVAEVPREQLIRFHVATGELGRKKQRDSGKDRMTVICDIRNMGISIFANRSAKSLMTEFAHIDQRRYPENMYKMLVVNAPTGFSLIYRLVRPLLEERVQKKISVLGSLKELQEWVADDQLPPALGGSSANWRTVGVELHEIRSLKVAMKRQAEKHAQQRAAMDVALAAEAVSREKDKARSQGSSSGARKRGGSLISSRLRNRGTSIIRKRSDSLTTSSAVMAMRATPPRSPPRVSPVEVACTVPPAVVARCLKCPPPLPMFGNLLHRQLDGSLGWLRCVLSVSLDGECMSCALQGGETTLLQLRLPDDVMWACECAVDAVPPAFLWLFTASLSTMSSVLAIKAATNHSVALLVYSTHSATGRQEWLHWLWSHHPSTNRQQSVDWKQTLLQQPEDLICLGV